LNRQLTRRFLFSVGGGYGHFHPLVPLARALNEKGHEVAFASGPSLQQLIEAAGFTFLQVGGPNRADDPEYQQFRTQQQAMTLGLESELFSYPRLFCGIGARLRIPSLVEIAREWQPDMLIRDAASYSAVITAEYLGLPHAAVSSAAALKSMAYFELEAAEYLDPIRQSWGLAPDPTLASLYRYLFLAYSPPTFSMHDVAGLGAPEIQASIPATTHFVRPEVFDNAGNESLPDWVTQLSENGQPVVYVTLGTEVNNEPELYPVVLQTIIAGLRDLPVNLIVTLGRSKDPADFGPQPANVHIEPYIPQSLLLPFCDLMVMHGGSNSVLAALDIGLPMVVVPLIADQFFNANVAQSLRLGQVVQRGQLTTASIRAAVEGVLHNPAYRQNVERLQAEMHALPDQEYAVELVERVAAEHRPVLNAKLRGSV
jgi:UDP:flavonoid glycosyltransferase YjiC (YdhE family)